MMGPAPFRNALQMLLLDRVYLEDLFADRVRLEAQWSKVMTSVSGWPTSAARLSRRRSRSGRRPSSRSIKSPPMSRCRRGPSVPSRSPLRPSAAAMAKANPILVEMRWKGGRKRTLAVLDLPPAVSVHKLLYGQAPEVVYPVSIHNFTNASSYPVEVKVYAKDRPTTPVLVMSQTGTARRADTRRSNSACPSNPAPTPSRRRPSARRTRPSSASARRRARSP